MFIQIMGRRMILTVVAILACVFTPLRNVVAAEHALVAELRQLTGKPVEAVSHQKTGRLKFLGFEQGYQVAGSPVMRKDVAAGSEGTAAAFLERYATLFGVDDPGRDLTVKKTVTDKGRNFIRYQQHYQGLPVIGGELIVHLYNNAIVTASGKASRISALETAPAITPDEARVTAQRLISALYPESAGQLTASEPVLSVYNPSVFGHDRDVNQLVWQLELKSGDGAPIREFVLIDAQSGQMALHFNQVDFAKNRMIYDKNSVPSNTLPGTLRRSEGQAATGDAEVDSVYDFIGDTYDFYFGNFGRDSVNGSGMTIIGTVRFVPANTTPPYNNAYWNGTQMVCGITQCTDDTVGHELTHGVIDFTANLYYYMQSGAINESLADIMGEFIDLGNGAGNDAPSQRWLFSEDSGAIRNMSNPPAYGHPDRMLSTLYSCGASDNGGVHSNSGVNNKAAVLMTDGGTFNGKTVVGLGITKVAKIYYEALTKMLVSASDHGDLYYAVKTACSNLTATGVTTTADCLEVAKALDAVEMNQQPTSCPAPDAPLCDAGKNPANLFFDDFESGPSKWQLTVTQGTDPWSDQNGSLVNQTPYASSGTGHLWGYDNEATTDSSVRTASAIAVPSGAYLHFMHAYDFEFDSGGYYDGGVVEYSTNGTNWTDAGSLITSNGYPHAIYNGTNPLKGRSAFTGLSNGYGSSRLDLSSLAGSNVYFRFRIGTDSSAGTKRGWFIDDVRVYTCVSSDAVLPILSAFSMPATSTSLTVTGLSITASDNVGVTGYYLSESSVKPLASAVGWLVTKPNSYTFASVGSKTLYLWVKDAAGNISNMLSATVSITDSIVPTISVFTLPATSASLTVTGISITASDNIGVTGYYLSESSVNPLASAPGWLSVKPTSYVFSSLGSKTLYLWVKDGAGNVSSVKSATTMIAIATSSNILQNGNFESGHNIWTEYCSDGSLNSIIASNAGSGNNGSSGYAAFGGYDGLTEYIYQDVTIPEDASAATLSFYYYITTTESSTTTAMYDNLYLEVLNPTTSATLATLTSLSNVNHNSAWTKSSDYNLLSYKGSTVRIRFRSTMDSTLPTRFNVDDVVVNVTTPGSLPLTVAVTGTGSGSVHSSPAGISCSSGSNTGCSANFTINSSVTLLPTPSGYSLLSGWSGCDSSSVSQCIVAMNDTRNVTATFTAAPRVKVGSKPFDTLQDAYNDAATTNNAIIKLLGGTLGGAFTAAGGKDVIIEGGYNADFSANPDMTVVDGPIVLQSGSVTVEGVAIK